MPTAHNSQLDVSNPQVVTAMTQVVLKWIKSHPDAGYVAISQNDNRDHYCKGPRCMKLIKAQGSPAAPQLKFVNEVAKRIHVHYPNIKVMTLAYHYTLKPPKTIRPGKNVVIRMAPILADFGHPMISHWNDKERSDIIAWEKISPQLFLWNYVTDFHHAMYPHPNWAGLAKDLRFYAAHHVTGIFEQGNDVTGQVGNFLPLRTWLLGHLMWNPKLSQKKLTTEFLQGYYGAAAPYLHQYLNLVENSFLSEHRRLSTFDLNFDFITLPVVKKGIDLFRHAAATVKSDASLTARVRLSRLSLDTIVLHKWRTLYREARQSGQTIEVLNDPTIMYKDYIKICKKYHVRNYGRGIFISTAPLPTFAKKYPRYDVIDIQPVAMSLFHKSTLCGITHDSTASNKKAAYIIGSTTNWEVQAHLSTFGFLNGRWHVYVYARLDAKPDAHLSGNGINAGVYDVTNKKSIAHVPIPALKAVGKTYHRFDLGVHHLNSGMYIWFAPFNKPSVKKIFIDRIILIRVKGDS